MWFENLQNLIWIEKTGLIETAKYLGLVIPLFLFMFYVSSIVFLQNYLWKLNKKNTPNLNLTWLLKKEIIDENNISFSIFLWSRMISISIIISYALVLNFVWVIIFSILWYFIQLISIKIFEKLLNIDLINVLIEKQNIPVSILYWFLVISLSTLIWVCLI